MAAAVSLAGSRGDPQVGYDVRIHRTWDAASRDFEAALRLGAATPFQDLHVVGSWYRAMASRPDIEPVIVSVRDRDTGVPALTLPLVRRRHGWVRTIGFADLDLVDCNAPILGPAAPRTADGAAALWRVLLRAIPTADLIHFRKMPRTIGTQPNPLALLPTLPCELNGNVVHPGDDYDAYRHGTLKRVVRKELERSWRVFSRQPGTAFGAIVEPAERRRVLATIEAQQPLRMARVGKTYTLDAPSAADFYRRLVDSDPTGQDVVLVALTAGDEIVAALMGLRQGSSFTMIRISSSSDPAWSNCSPGRLVIERAMAHLHAEGVRVFDFSVGNYDYKRRFAVEPSELVDLVRPLTPLGLGGAARIHGLAWLRQRPDIEARLRRILRRPPSQERVQ